LSVGTELAIYKVVALVEKQAILHALAVANGNKLEAAKILEVGKTSFYEKCKLYQIK
jgi:transcriptional regulator with PAS, ATPase and Fis domain